jgi:transposase, IS30 family
MGRHVSTISREVRNNRNAFTLEYTKKAAKQKAYVRKKYCKYQKRKILEDMKLREFIEEHLQLDWSPEEVAGRIAEEFSLSRLETKCSKSILSINTFIQHKDNL